MIAFDTNIVIYLLNGNPAFYEQAKAVIAAAQDQTGCVSTLLITEVLQYPAFEDMQQLRIAEQFLDSMNFVDFILVDERVARQSAAVLRAYPQLRLPDAIHIATAVVAGASEFWTNDKKLAKVNVTGLTVRLLPSNGSAV